MLLLTERILVQNSTDNMYCKSRHVWPEIRPFKKKRIYAGENKYLTINMKNTFHGLFEDAFICFRHFKIIY